MPGIKNFTYKDIKAKKIEKTHRITNLQAV